MTIHMRCEEMLRECEKLLREADQDVEHAKRTYTAVGRAKSVKRRNAINAACNALHRATRA